MKNSAIFFYFSWKRKGDLKVLKEDSFYFEHHQRFIILHCSFRWLNNQIRTIMLSPSGYLDTLLCMKKKIFFLCYSFKQIQKLKIKLQDFFFFQELNLWSPFLFNNKPIALSPIRIFMKKSVSENILHSIFFHFRTHHAITNI